MLLKKIRIVIAEPGKPAEIRECENTLEAMQALVGGYLECVTIWSGHDMWVNENGAQLKPNRKVAAYSKTFGDEAFWPILGTLFIANHTEDGDMESLDLNAATMLVAELNGTRFCHLLSPILLT